MKYKVKHPSKDLPKALGIKRTRVNEIDDAIESAINENFETMDEICAHVAPFINTAEEGFYVGCMLTSMLNEAENAVK